MSHVAVSFESPEYTADVDAMGTLRLLEAIRFLGLEKKTRFYGPPPLNCTVWCRKSRRKRPRRSTRVPLCGGETVRLLDHRQLP